MKLSIQVKTGKKANKVTSVDDAHLIVEVIARPEQGKANDAVLRVLAKHFAVTPSRLGIVRGMTSPKKIIEISK